MKRLEIVGLEGLGEVRPGDSIAALIVEACVKQGMTLVAIGIVIGLAGAFGASRVIRGVLYGGGENDPLTFIVVPLILAAVAVLAIWIPARRASGLDPLLALRTE